MENNNQNISENEQTAVEESRPPVDPKNKLYTVISLLIFAVLYTGMEFLKANFTLSYALYDDMPSAENLTVILREIGMEQLPEGYSFRYARLHNNFDSNTLYIALSLPEDTEEPSEIEEYIPYSFGNIVEDERFTVYPDADMTAEYVYGNSYVCMDDPMESCLVYEDEDGYTAVFRVNDYDSKIKSALSEGVKISVK